MAEVSFNPGEVPPSEIREQSRELSPVYRRTIVVLSLGFRIGALVLAIGLALALIKQESLRRTAEAYPDIFPAILDGEANGFISLAIIILLATPVVAVLFVALGFLRVGDRRFGLLSLVVLGVLGVSITLSLFR